MIYPAIAAVISLVVGVAIGYGLAYRYKQQYEITRRQLANLRGENYRGQVTAIPLRASAAAANAQPAEATELQQLRQRCARLEEELAEAKTEPSEPQNNDVVTAPETSPVTGTEQWQLAQLHREQIAMQLELEQHQAQVESLKAELDSIRSESHQDLLELRTILGEHEATIASLERDKASLVERLRLVDPRP